MLMEPVRVVSMIESLVGSAHAGIVMLHTISTVSSMEMIFFMYQVSFLFVKMIVMKAAASSMTRGR